MFILSIKALNEDVLNQYSNHSTYHEGDSGLDLFVSEDITIPAWSTAFIDHKIQCEMVRQMPNPQMRGIMGSLKMEYDSFNETFLLFPRSSISKTPLIMANSIGLCDAGYRGNIIGAVRNLSNEPYTVEKGTRLFQICQRNYEPFSFKMVENLSDSTRGEGGFGSTGK